MLRLRSTTLLALPLLFSPLFVCGQAGSPEKTQTLPSVSSSGLSSSPQDDQTLAPMAPPIPADAHHMSKDTRYQIIRDFEAQVVYARTAFPMGAKGLDLKRGTISPSGEELRQQLTLWGPAIKAGDPAQISFVRIRNDHIQFEINGGPIHRKKWYQRIEVTGAYGQPVPTSPSDAQSNPHGSFVNLYFDKYVPEMTPQQLKALLYPVLDFNARNKEQAYLDTVPPKVKEAIQAHHVLVGMNREMVLHAKGKPPKKVRERDGETVYEEWIYGEPPADVDFVRLVDDEVVRVETMKVDGTKILRTEREVILPSDENKNKEAKKEQPDRPANAPSLRRPGEDSETVPKPATGPSPLPPMPPPDIPQPQGGPNGMLPAR
jgi:hypothetical protein